MSCVSHITEPISLTISEVKAVGLRQIRALYHYIQPSCLLIRNQDQVKAWKVLQIEGEDGDRDVVDVAQEEDVDVVVLLRLR